MVVVEEGVRIAELADNACPALPPTRQLARPAPGCQAFDSLKTDGQFKISPGASYNQTVSALATRISHLEEVIEKQSTLLREAIGRRADEDARPTGPLSSDALRGRQKQVLVLLALGYSHKEIGQRLNVSAKTVETYKSRLGDKSGLRSRPQIVLYALQRGWLDDRTLTANVASPHPPRATR